MLKFLVGSHNYNLETPSSDKDWKVFNYPTFEHLFKGEYNNAPNTLSEDEDVEYKDIRQLVPLLLKCNPSYLEVLYSKETEHSDEMENSKFLKFIQDNRDAIAFHNLPKFFDACVGMYHQKRKLLEKDPPNKKYCGKDIYNYSFKAGVQAYRSLDLIERLVHVIRSICYNEASKSLIDPEILPLKDTIFLPYILKGAYQEISQSVYFKVLRYEEMSDRINDPRPWNREWIIKEGSEYLKYLAEYSLRSCDKIKVIQQGKYTYQKLIAILDEKEQRVLELKNHPIFDKKFVSTEILDQAQKILEKEILERIIKTNIRIEKIDDLENNNGEYLEKITTKTPVVVEEDCGIRNLKIEEIHFLIKLREKVNNDLYKKINLPSSQFKPRETSDKE